MEAIQNLHDWTLKSIEVDWAEGRAILSLKGPYGNRDLIAHAVRDLQVPKAEPWGRSVSINTVTGPDASPEGRERLEIEMQSGDVIAILARSFELTELTPA